MFAEGFLDARSINRATRFTMKQTGVDVTFRSMKAGDISSATSRSTGRPFMAQTLARADRRFVENNFHRRAVPISRVGLQAYFEPWLL